MAEYSQLLLPQFFNIEETDCEGFCLQKLCHVEALGYPWGFRTS